MIHKSILMFRLVRSSILLALLTTLIQMVLVSLQQPINGVNQYKFTVSKKSIKLMKLKLAITNN